LQNIGKISFLFVIFFHFNLIGLLPWWHQDNSIMITDHVKLYMIGPFQMKQYETVKSIIDLELKLIAVMEDTVVGSEEIYPEYMAQLERLYELNLPDLSDCSQLLNGINLNAEEEFVDR